MRIRRAAVGSEGGLVPGSVGAGAGVFTRETQGAGVTHSASYKMSVLLMEMIVSAREYEMAIYLDHY